MIQKNVDLSRYSSIKIGPKKILLIAESVAEAMSLHTKGYEIIGLANNILFSPEVKNIFKLGNAFNFIEEEGNYLEIGASTNSRKIFSYAKRFNLGGLEFLAALPGSLGAIIKMNAGMKQHEIKNMLLSVNINNQWIDATNIDFSYRDSGIKGLILGARVKKIRGFDFKLERELMMARMAHPLNPSCGSCFKNPSGGLSAGYLLQSAGFKGRSFGGIAFSNLHANFLININKGSFSDAKTLISLAREQVMLKHGISLELEIVML